mgnify:CR=1 FL=1
MSQTLLLIDGSNYLFRAFHALPDLRTSAGEPTGAIKGFVSMLGAVRAIVKPDFGVCVFDAKGKTFRSDIYPEYKANRPPMPDDLASQIRPIQHLIAFFYPQLSKFPVIINSRRIDHYNRAGRKKFHRFYDRICCCSLYVGDYSQILSCHRIDDT